MEINTETTAKQARVGPRTSMHISMKMLFWKIISSTSAGLSDMIVRYIVSKIWIELIKPRNDNGVEKFYRLRTFQKLIFSVEISKKSKIFEK